MPVFTQSLQSARVLREDDFLVSSTESGEIGDLGWIVVGTSSTGALVNGAAGHPGIMQIASGATSGNLSAFQLGTAHILASSLDRFIAIGRIPTITAVLCRIGWMQSPSTADGGTAGIYFEFDSSLSANWAAVTRTASAETRGATGIAVTANNWYLLEARVNGANWDFYINGALTVTNSANQPTSTAGAFGWASETTENVTKTLDADYFAYQTVALGQRYT